MSELYRSSIHRNLDIKLRIVGLEAHDLLMIFLFAAIMNFIFGTTAIGFYMVFVIPTLMAITLYLGKRGKPDGFLIHLIRFYTQKGIFLAGDEAMNKKKMKLKIYY